VQHAAVVSNAAPSYAPVGRHLVQATCLPGRGGAGAGDEVAVRQHLAELWGRPTRDWDLLVRHEVTHALPAQPAPLRPAAEARVGERVYAAGDHRDTASIQGALVSGERVARAVLAGLG
jgi:predicted NAD/FAD-dependent oxidoreductase